MKHFEKYKQLIKAKEFELAYYTCIATGFVDKEEFVKDCIIPSIMRVITTTRLFKYMIVRLKRKEYNFYLVDGGYTSRPHLYINRKTYFPKNAKSTVKGDGFTLKINRFPNEEIKEILLKNSNHLIGKWIQQLSSKK